MKPTSKRVVRRRLKTTTTPTTGRSEAAADAVFTRLLRDVSLAHRVQRRVRAAALTRDYFDKAEQLERQAFRHLAAYLSAKAFVVKAIPENEERR